MFSRLRLLHGVMPPAYFLYQAKTEHILYITEQLFLSVGTFSLYEAHIRKSATITKLVIC